MIPGVRRSVKLLRAIATTYLPYPVKNLLRALTVDVASLELSRRAMEKILIRILDEDSISQPFNRQQKRLQIYREITSRLTFETFIETGTFLGDTTDLFLETGRSMVYTVEVNPLLFAFAKRRFKGRHNLKMFNTSSVDFLRRLDDPDVLQRPCFIYLDAHWYDYVPLKDELDIIREKFSRYLILIDDFKVEGDDCYAYDLYGFHEFRLDYLKGHIDGEHVFFPRVPASAETGLKRGCVFLTSDEEFARTLDRCDLLVRFNVARPAAR